MPEQRNLEYHVLEWFKGELSGLEVLEQVLLEFFNLVFVYELSLIVSIGLQLGLDHIIRAKGLLARICD